MDYRLRACQLFINCEAVAKEAGVREYDMQALIYQTGAFQAAFSMVSSRIRRERSLTFLHERYGSIPGKAKPFSQIAKEYGLSPETVRHYVQDARWFLYRSQYRIENAIWGEWLDTLVIPKTQREVEYLKQLEDL